MTRLNTAERTRLQEIVKDYEKAEKQLEDAIK
jgi:exonuclease VII small subunit